MGLIHNDEVKVRVAGCDLSIGMPHQEFEAAKDQLFAKEGIRFMALKVSFLIKEAYSEIEASAHFNEPLMQKRFRHHDEDPLGFPRKQLMMKDHPRFDGLAKPDLIGK